MESKDLSDNDRLEAITGDLSDVPTENTGGESELEGALENRFKGILDPSAERFSDTPGSPRETVNESLIGAVRQELRQEILAVFKNGIKKYLNPFNITTKEERIAIEEEVHKNLYPSTKKLMSK